MRAPLRLAPALLISGALQGQAPDLTDSQLATLIRDALATNPQLKASQASIEVERAKVSQAGALPDPMASLGYQNDGFRKFTYGESGFAFAQVGLSQAFPYPGKRKLREQIAQAGVAAADAALDRVRLDLIADVKRSYYDLLRVQGQRTLLDAQAKLWDQVAEATQARVEAGTGTTADLLRAQLEKTRLKQREADLEGRAVALEAELNRLAGHGPGSSLETAAALDALPLPQPPDAAQAVTDAIANSPELSEARHHLVHYRQQVDLAKLDLRPDFTVGAALMPQGSLPGMWSVSVGFNVPLWSGRKQKQAVAGARAQAQAEDYRITDLEQRLASLTRARAARFAADLQVARLYQKGLLAQSDAAYQAALTQFSTGTEPFRQVLEALSNRIKDRSDYLDALAQAHFDAIELERASPGATTDTNAMDGGAP
ncbi:MAG TPA: TolC family protein [Holophagaceae bacterium]|jgi:cobalt-zinc-cadmium efflux system outer membrane protein|nr:TolC family protein [Holophagaceae bacterium]